MGHLNIYFLQENDHFFLNFHSNFEGQTAGEGVRQKIGVNIIVTLLIYKSF